MKSVNDRDLSLLNGAKCDPYLITSWRGLCVFHARKLSNFASDSARVDLLKNTCLRLFVLVLRVAGRPPVQTRFLVIQDLTSENIHHLPL